MNYSSLEIRAAMVELGQKRGAEYSLCVVRDVVQAFKLDAAHPIKDLVAQLIQSKRTALEVIQEPEIPAEYVDPAKAVELRTWFDRRGLMIAMSEKLNVHKNSLSRWLLGQALMPIDAYERIVQEFDQFKAEFLAAEVAREEAKKQGFSTYKGRPCRSCQSTLRYTSGANCIACSRSRKRKAHAMKQQVAA